MKKKVGLVFLIVVLSLFSVSAGINKVSITGFYSLSSGKESISIAGITSSSQVKGSGIGLRVQGTSFFSPTSDLGVSYKIATAKTLSSSADGVSVDTKNSPLVWGFGVGGAYQIHPSANMFVEVGAGVDYTIQSETNSGVTAKATLFSLAAKAELNYAIKNNLYFDAGVVVSYPLWGSVSVSGSGMTISGDVTSSVFTFSPYVGVSIAY